LFTDGAYEFFDEAYKKGLFYRIIGTDAVYHGTELTSREWFVCAPISDLFARIILRIHHNRSVSSLLDNRQIIQDMIAKSQEKKQKPHEGQ
jgi:ribose-phosphate pyrophosphokinase